jgi:hypothetical protein
MKGMLCRACFTAAMMWLILSLTAPTAAQNRYAAVLTVTYPGVELRRVNTEKWLTLPLDSQSPFGAGDVVRTDNRGRAYITFLDTAAETLLLPRTSYELRTFGAADGEPLALTVRLQGRAIQRIAADSAIKHYELETDRFVITQPALQFAVQTKAAQATVMVAEGDTVVTVNQQHITVTRGSGLRVKEVPSPITALDAPLNFARLDGALDGCAGVVSTRVIGSLNVRTYASYSLESDVIGSIDNDVRVPIMGITDRAGVPWYRVQFLNDFGWVTADSIKTDCKNLTPLPNLPSDDLTGVYDLSAFELAFLEPYYGRPQDNAWFFRNTKG